MEPQDNVIMLDPSRMRPGMRGLAHQIAVDMGNPLNIDLWHPYPSAASGRVTATEVIGTLGPLSELWQMDDRDAASRITHMTLLVLHAVQSQQFRDTSMLARAMQCQAAAESVRLRIEEVEASRHACQTSGS